MTSINISDNKTLLFIYYYLINSKNDGKILHDSERQTGKKNQKTRKFIL